MSKCLLIALVAAALLVATPVVAQNNAGNPDQSQAAPRDKTANDISGMYTFLKDGEFVQINQEDESMITGFISRYGDDESDKKIFLDQFFTKGTLKGDSLTFATKVIHGTWYEFSGTVQRGPGKKPSDEAYRIIKGKLIRHHANENGKDMAESREIEMKSFPADSDSD